MAIVTGASGRPRAATGCSPLPDEIARAGPPLRPLLIALLLVLLAVDCLAAIIASGILRRLLKGLHQGRDGSAIASNEVNNPIKTEDDAIQGARDTLSRLSGNARNTQQLLERFHV